MMQKRRLSLFDYLYIIIGTPWLFLMIMSTGLYSALKVSLLAVLLVISLAEIIYRGIGFARNEFCYTGIFVFYFFLTIIVSLVNGFEFSISADFSLVQYYIMTPICVLFFANVWSYFPDRKNFIWELLKWLTFLLSVFDVMKILSFRMGLSLPFLSFIKVSNNITEGVLAIRVSNESSFMFLIPIYIFMLFAGKTRKRLDLLLYAGSVFFGVVYAVISGRKMLELIILISFIVSLGYRLYKHSSTRRELMKNLRLIVVLVLLVVVLFFALQRFSSIIGVENILQRAWETLRNGLMSSDRGISKRVTNAQALMDLWGKSPLWGNGLSAYAKDSLASETSKWSYEVVYVALLAQTGVIGVTIVLIGILYLFRKVWINFKMTNNVIYLSVLLGFVAFIAAGATNPLVYFVWPWTIALLFAKRVDDHYLYEES